MPVSRTTSFSESSSIPTYGHPFGKLKRDDMSEECQREHWELHKTQCKLTEKQRRSCEGDEILTRMNNELFKWTAKHHPTISKTVIDALEVHDRPRTEDDELVLVFLSYEPRTPMIEKRFKVMSAGRASFDSILKLSTNPVLAELPRQRRLMEADHLRKNRNVGVAFCLLVCMMPGAREGRSTSTSSSPSSSSLHRIVPITFQKELTPSEKEVFRRKRNPNWLSFLVDTTDKGIVF
ncbi:hypothetical protein Clacol_008673 [Clathrus columnatus]|uniref:Uncharacterized protein n=1 Tax=Clathrus columnatus TaxID=1419009 RepID=A0AAV5AP09_9AGAM|nr:hypothetical protein Clacol_008673 [Clathrus columnatus]